MGVALYDAVNVANQFSKNGAQKEQAKYLEKPILTHVQLIQ